MSRHRTFVIINPLLYPYPFVYMHTHILYVHSSCCLGYCASCNEPVIGMKNGCAALEKVYHVKCFNCSKCGKCACGSVQILAGVQALLNNIIVCSKCGETGGAITWTLYYGDTVIVNTESVPTARLYSVSQYSTLLAQYAASSVRC